MIALSLGACRLEPPGAPEEEVRLRSEAESDRRAALAAGAEAEAEVEQTHAAVRVAALEVLEREDAAGQTERYTKTLAEAQANASDCSADVERLIEIHTYLAGYASEPRRDAAISGLENCRKLAARTRKHDDRLARSWLPAPTSGRSTPRAADDPWLAELPRLRGELAGAEAGLQAAQAARTHAGEAAEAARGTLSRLAGAQQEREAQWRGRMYESVRPIWISGGVMTGGSAIAVFASMLLLEARGDITSGEKEFASDAERNAALRQNTNGQIACYSVAVPLLVAGVVLFVVGKRRWVASGIGLSASAGGFSLRF